MSETTKFRKKPIVISAAQWFPDAEIEGVITDPLRVRFYEPRGGEPAIHADPAIADCLETGVHGHPKVGAIPTLEGWHLVLPGDWVITGIQGEKYPCKPDIFEMTYENASDPAAESGDTATGQAMRAYLEAALKLGHIDHALRAEIDPANGGVKFYIHPYGKDGETMDVNMGARPAAG